MADNQETRRLSGPIARVTKLQFSPDGQQLAASHANGELWVWELSTQTAVLKIQQANEAWDISANGLRLALITAGGELSCYDLMSGEEIKRSTLALRPSIIKCHPVEPVVAIVAEREVRLFNWETGQLIKKFAHSDVVSALAWRSDARLLATGTGDNRVWVWDVESGQSQVLIGHTAGVFDVSFNPRGPWLSENAHLGRAHGQTGARSQ